MTAVAKQPFLTVYDYGVGAVWAVVLSPDKRSVQRKFPILDVFDEQPLWMSDHDYAAIVERNLYDIDDEPAAVLQFMLEEIQRRAGAPGQDKRVSRRTA
jgi:hypothetical protein